MSDRASVTDKLFKDESVLFELMQQMTEQLHHGDVIDIESLVREYPRYAERLRHVATTLHVLGNLADGSSAGVNIPSANDEDRIELIADGLLGDFRIVHEIGRGGMGIVYEARQISLSRRVALKILPFAAVLDPRQLQRFKSEAQVAAQLTHQNIVPVYSVGCDRGVHYYAMQFIDGHTVATVVDQLRKLEGSHDAAHATADAFRFASDLASGVLAKTDAHVERVAEPARAFVATETETTDTVAQMQAAISTERSTKNHTFFRSVAQLGIQVAEALEYAHGEGVIHRDIKPSNLILDGRGKVFIADFGLAHVDGGCALTMTGEFLGTLRYMSPEQALAQRVMVDHRTDIYSLGTTLYELLTLELAYTGNDRQKLLRQIAFEEPRPPRWHNKLIPAELETIVLKAMAKNPSERYDTAQELADDLRRFLEDKPIQARRPTLAQRAAKWSRRHRPIVASAAAASALVLIVAAIASSIIAHGAIRARNKETALRQRNHQA